MMCIAMDMTTHIWEKTGYVKKNVDGINITEYQCTECKIKGINRRPGYIELTGDVKDPYNCKKEIRPLQIKITHCNVDSDQFKNLVPGSIHAVIDPPPGEYGIWVMGVDTPIKVLPGEYVSIVLSQEQIEKQKKRWFDDIL